MKVLSLVLLMLVLAACEAEGDAGGGDLPEPVCISEAGALAPDFVGLTEGEANDLAEERGLQVREVGRDGECFVVTEDFRTDRVNLEFAGDLVVGAAIY